MKIEEVLELWSKDSIVDKTELADESIKIPKLHHKYYNIFVHERLRLKALELEYKKLKLAKHEFYTQGPNEETRDKGWKMPPIGRPLKSDIPMYMDADSDISEIALRIAYQNEVVELLESIIKSLINRGYNIKTAVDFIRFTNGA